MTKRVEPQHMSLQGAVSICPWLKASFLHSSPWLWVYEGSLRLPASSESLCCIFSQAHKLFLLVETPGHFLESRLPSLWQHTSALNNCHHGLRYLLHFVKLTQRWHLPLKPQTFEKVYNSSNHKIIKQLLASLLAKVQVHCGHRSALNWVRNL